MDPDPVAIEYGRPAQLVRVRNNDRRISIVVAPPPRWWQLGAALLLLLILIGGAGFLILTVCMIAADPQHLKNRNILTLLAVMASIPVYASSTYRRMIRLLRFGRLRIRITADSEGLSLLAPREIGRHRRFLDWASIRDAKALSGGWSMLLVPVAKLKIDTWGLEEFSVAVAARDPHLMESINLLLARRPQ